MADFFPYGPPQFFNDDGNLLVSGKVGTYEAKTSDESNTFIESSESANAANPIVLDAAGRCEIWTGPGKQKLVCKDSNDRLIWTLDDVVGIQTAGNLQSATTTYAADTGTANTITAILTPAVTVYPEGLTAHILINNVNTGKTTFNLNGLGALQTRRDGTSALSGGELLAGEIRSFVVSGGLAHLTNPSKKSKKAFVYSSKSMSIPDATLTMVDWGSSNIVTDDGFFDSSNSNIFTIPDGVKHVQVSTSFNESAAGRTVAQIHKNGAVVTRIAYSHGGSYVLPLTTGPIAVTTGDTFSVHFYHDSAGSENILLEFGYSHFAIEECE